MSRTSLHVVLTRLVLTAALSGFGAAGAGTTTGEPNGDRPTLDFVGEWPVTDNGVGLERPSAGEAAHAVAPGQAVGAAVPDGERISCARWAFGRVVSLWQTTLGSFRTAWSNVRRALFFMPD